MPVDGSLYVRAQELIVFIAPGQDPPEGMVAFREIATWEELDREPLVGALYEHFLAEGAQPVCVETTESDDKLRAIYVVASALCARDRLRTTL